MDLTKIRRRQERERQKPLGLMSKTRSPRVSHAFLLILLSSLSQLPGEMANFTWYLTEGRQRINKKGLFGNGNGKVVISFTLVSV